MSIELISHYHQEEKYRQAFIKFIPKVFPGVSFEEWHQRGYWQDDFHGHAIYDHDSQKILANLSLGLMDIYLDGQLKKGIQLSSAGVLPQARKQGYLKQLMDHVIAIYSDNADLIFLFGNPSVVDFYPRFGFRQEPYYNFKMPHPDDLFCSFVAKRLDIHQPKDWEMIADFTANRSPVTTLFGTTNEANVLNWSLLNPFQDKIWYLPGYDIIVIAETQEGILRIYDILSKEPLENISFNDILAGISLPATHTVLFLFSPEKLGVKAKSVPVDGSVPFFVRGDFLPPGTHFRFPILART